MLPGKRKWMFAFAGLTVAAVFFASACLAASFMYPRPTFGLSADRHSLRPVDYPVLQAWGDRLRGRRYLTLTFDDGPYGGGIDERLLDILQRHHARAVFFVVCSRLDLADHNLLRRALNDGNVIGNHSFDHAHLPQETADRLDHEIAGCSRAIAGLTGRCPPFFRSPFGQTSPAIRTRVRVAGMREMLWDANSQDSWLTRPQQILSWVDRESGDFSILLMHSKPTTAAVLDRALTELERRGFQFVLPEREPVRAVPKAAS